MVTKPIKIMLSCIVALILILLIMVYTLLFIIDINNFKPQISTLAKNKISRNLMLNGQLKLVVFPELSLSTGPVTLGNPAGFQNYFMSVDDISMRLKPLPLLLKKINADTVQIHGLKLNLITNKQGINNWDSGWPSKSGGTPTNLRAIVKELTIKDINLENAQINWDDQQADQAIEVKNFNLATSLIATNAPIVSHFALTALDKKNQLSISLTGQTALKFNDNLDIFALTHNALQATVTGKAIPGKSATFTVSSKEVLIDKTKQTVKTSDLQLKLADLLITSDMMANLNTNPPELGGKACIMPFNPSNLMKQLTLSLPPRRDKNVFKYLDGQFSFYATTNAFEFNGLAVNLDDSTITGSVTIKNGSKPKATFNLAIDAIDVDRYLPPVNKSAEPTEPSDLLAITPVETLRELRTTGTLAIDKLHMNGSTLQNIQLSLGE